MSSERIAHRSWMRQAIGVIVLVGGLGCGETEYLATQRNVIKIEALPANILAAAKKALPNITFEDTWENLGKDQKIESYEVRGKDSKGKIREVRVGLDSVILEVE